MTEVKVKNSVRIDGTTFNKLAVANMSKEEFVSEFMKHSHVFPSLEQDKKQKRLADVYTDIKGKPAIAEPVKVDLKK